MLEEYDIKKLNPRPNPYAKEFVFPAKEGEKSKYLRVKEIGMEPVKFRIAFKEEGAGSEEARDFIRKTFCEYGYSCIEEQGCLTAVGKGIDSDFGIMWSIVLDWIEYDWFEEKVSSCVFIEGEEREDVIPQLPELKRMFEMD